MTKQQVLNELRGFTGVFPVEAVRAVQSDKEAYIPDLLSALEYAYENISDVREADGDYYLYMYAAFLLAEFREKRAFPLIINLMRLNEDDIEFLFSDILTEYFGKLLLCTYNTDDIRLVYDIIENTELYEFSRSAALSAYKYLINEGHIAKDEAAAYLRSLIYEKLPRDDSDVVFTGILGCIYGARLYEMLPDAMYLYDNDMADTMMYGDYDGFLDCMYSKKRPKDLYIDDTVSVMQDWYCFNAKDETDNRRETDNLQALFDEVREEAHRERISRGRPKKTGRNAPCPCGSGRKYKHCCLDKYENAADDIESRYDLLEYYPKDSELFAQTYEKEAVDIDMLAYKALHRRAIPVWVKRDYNRERIGKIRYLAEALKLFTDKCRREGIKSFAAYDEKYMIHYRSREWVSALINLINEEGAGAFPEEKKTALNVIREFAR